MKYENFKSINIDEMPKRRTRLSEVWNKIFSSVSEGQALVIPKKTVGSASVRTALRNRQKQDTFKNLVVIVRNENIYILNPKKKHEVI
jgi:hypothetical protein